jgi:hypothetical protein
MKLRTVFTTAITALIIIAVGSVSLVMASGQEDDDVSGTVSGVDWTGTAYLAWDSDCCNGYYEGQGTTGTDDFSDIDALEIRNRGRELCSGIPYQTDWDEGQYDEDDWFVVVNDFTGHFLFGECFSLDLIVSSRSDHDAWHGSEHDSDESDAWDVTPY